MPGLDGTNANYLNSKIATSDLLLKINHNIRKFKREGNIEECCCLDLITGKVHECDEEFSGENGKPNCLMCVNKWLNGPSEM